MEIKWLEDFVTLAQVKNFSKAAELRNVTQPAFSRRIQSLELWLGAPLIDRSCFPLELTSSGDYFYEQSMALLGTFYDVRRTVKGASSGRDLTIDFSVPHNLSLAFFPQWIKEASKHLSGVSFRLRALNVHDAVMTLLGGSSDLLIAYSHPCSSLRLDPLQYASKLLGVERMFLYGLSDLGAQFEKTPCLEVPFLAYGAGAYLGKIADHIVTQSPIHINLKKVYETDMAEGLKSMVLAGHGYAFLPESSVKKEFDEGLIVKAFPCEGNLLDAELEIRLFRELDESLLEVQPRLENSTSIKQRIIENLWSHL